MTFDKYKTGQVQEEPKKAARYNAGKLPLELIPPEFEEELGKVFGKGAVKYEPDNWKNSANTEDHDAFVRKCVGCMRRHILAYLKGEFIDPDRPTGYTGPDTTHLGHIAWNALAILWYHLNDTREK